MALERGIAGLVSLRLEIGADGRVTSVAVTREEPDGYGFARAAVEAVRQARFSPLLINGEPAPGTFSYQVRFQVTQ